MPLHLSLCVCVCVCVSLSLSYSNCGNVGSLSSSFQGNRRFLGSGFSSGSSSLSNPARSSPASRARCHSNLFASALYIHTHTYTMLIQGCIFPLVHV